VKGSALHSSRVVYDAPIRCAHDDYARLTFVLVHKASDGRIQRSCDLAHNENGRHF